MDWENHLEKKTDPENRKNQSKNQSAIAACEKKPLARERIFDQTTFSHSTLKLIRKISRRKNTRSISCFGVTKITTAI